MVPTRMRVNGNFSDANLEQLHLLRKSCVMSPSDATDLESPLSAGVQAAAFLNSHDHLFSCRNDKLLIAKCDAYVCSWHKQRAKGQLESEKLKFSATLTPQIENPSESFRCRMFLSPT